MKKLKILFYDIETSPHLALAWGLYNQNIPYVIRPSEVLCFAYKWQGEKDVTCVSRNNYYPHSEKPLIKKFLKVLNKADIIVTHNGDSFDNKVMNWAIIRHNLKRPMPVRTVDTLKVSRKNFRPKSHKLEDLAEALGIGRKLPHTGIKMWHGCMQNNKEDWQTMVKYNKHDVWPLLEEAYNRLRPWMDSHPVVTPSKGKRMCNKCGHNKLRSKGWQHNKSGSYRRLICLACQAPMIDSKKGKPNV